MRDSGVLDERAALTYADHVCWVYDDPASFVSAAQRYLAVGLRKGERLLCGGHGMAAELRAAGEPFGSLDALSARGALTSADVGSTHADGEPVSPADQWQFYDAAVREARAAGYRGLRVVADVTPLARTPAGRAGLVQWEHIADEFLASGSGMVAMSRLETVDVAGCRALSAWARAPAGRGVRLRIQGAPRSLVRIWRLLGMDGPAPVTFAGAVR